MDSQFNYDDPLGLNSEMTVNKETGGGNFVKEFLPKGINQFVIVGAWPAGTHKETYEGQTKTLKKVLLVFESKAKRSDGKPFTKNRKWTYTMADKSIMYKDLVGLGFDPNQSIDLRKLARLNFMANVTHELGKDGKIEKEKVGTFIPLMDGVAPIEPSTNEIPDWGKVYIAESAEYIQKYGKGIFGPYADALMKAEEKKKGGETKGSEGPRNEAPPPGEDDLPF